MSNFVKGAALAVAVAAGTVANASVVNQYNLIVTGNLQNNSIDVRGKVFVGGNLTGGAVTFAQDLNPAAFSGVDTVLIGGNTNVSKLAIKAGNLRRAGSFSGTLEFNGVNQTQTIDPTIPAQALAIAGELNTLSAYLAGLPATSSVTLPQNGQQGPLKYTVTGTSNGVAVFNVNAATAFNSNLIQQIELTSNAATSIVINVAGTSVNFSNGNMVGQWNSAFARANVIWNFYEATSISMTQKFNGAILAPLANLSNTTDIDGSVFVNTFNQSGEVHLPNYSGFIPAPGSIALLGLAGVVGVRRRRA